MFQKLFFGAGAGRSRAFIGGAGAETEIVYLEPDPKKKYLEPEPRKNGSAPQHWFALCSVADPYHFKTDQDPCKNDTDTMFWVFKLLDCHFFK